jgi:hypothetical protein
MVEGEGSPRDNALMPLDTYQQRASECLHLAEGSLTLEERATWRELALCWLRLSERAEEFRRRANHVEEVRAA